MDVNKNNIDYTAYIVEEKKPFNILAGIVLGVGFFPLTIFIVYYWCTKCFGGKEISDDEERNEIAWIVNINSFIFKHYYDIKKES